MNCEAAQERIVAAAYAELPDDEAHELERHLQDCAACRTEREQVLALQVLAGALPVMEPDANLVARARMRLDEALDAMPSRPLFDRVLARFRVSMSGLQSAPVAAVLVLAVGALSGAVGGYRLAQYGSNRSVQAQTPDIAASVASVGAQAESPAETASEVAEESADLSNVANVSAIARQGGGEMVDVTFNQMVPKHVTGSLDDAKIRQLLMLASENQASARVRGQSVSLLAAECKQGHNCQASGIRDALIVALRYDTSAEVREKALAGLEPYVAQDLRVRDAVLEALMTDSDPRIRSAGIGMLTPVEADTSVRQVLNTVSTSDENPHIRFVSRQILDRVPEIQ